MCHTSKIITSTINGEFSICSCCKIYSLTFNNLFFQFNKKQLQQFREYVADIDINYWLDCYSCSTRKRKIPIATPNNNLILFFNEREIQDLKLLMQVKKKPNSYLSPCQIDYTLVLN